MAGVSSRLNGSDRGEQAPLSKGEDIVTINSRIAIFSAVTGLLVLSGCATQSARPQANTGVNAQPAAAQTAAPARIGFGAGDSLGQTLFANPGAVHRDDGLASTGD